MGFLYNLVRAYPFGPGMQRCIIFNVTYGTNKVAK